MAPTSSSSSFHPALAVSNIKTHVPIALEMENVQYTNWAELFKVHCRSHKVLHHIIPPKSKDGEATEPTIFSQEEQELWDTLDATVVQWIYSTISTDLLNTVIEADVSAMTLWNRLRDLFQDNENSRAVSLEHEFNNTYLKDFSSISAYCQHLKTLSDQLKNVGAPVSNNRLVLRMVGGLTPAYKGVASVIRHKKVLPPFYEVRSMLALEETSMKEATTDDAMMVTNHDTDEISNHPPPGRARGKQNKHRNNKKNRKPTSIGVQTPGVGRGGNRGGGPNLGGGQQGPMQPTWAMPPWKTWMQPPWVMPPCPYPTQPWGRQVGPRQPGILGARPQQQQAYTTASEWAPTDIESAMHTMSLSQSDPNWYMDTGATSHMTSTQGNLSSYVNMSKDNSVTVGSGQSIPIRGYGHTVLPSPNPPLYLKHVLHTPNLIKNLVSVRKFTTDNNVSVVFDPCGFSVHDLQTGRRLMRCDSTSSLYPITPTRPHPASSPTVLLASTLWHDRLGHPGDSILSILQQNKLIACNSPSKSTILCTGKTYSVAFCSFIFSNFHAF
ncbi:flocculation protein FLO11-like [Hibiscus syriacus]|uniref:Flocculation protein FLO11-like n=1 Tax=Hibiscus syriacus TaxID=106335 RepID=A0A6A3BBJ8_HIBSY|nr:flocculation protein FLO11-like [Hibiscus syriacus]